MNKKSLPDDPMTTHDAVHVFGIRHLSPGGAWHLREFLDRIRPEVILIEGLADADELIPHIVGSDTRPPVAILAYTDELPVRTLVYPIAAYSPEYQALHWARAHGIEARFIDLPSDVFLSLPETSGIRPQTDEPLEPRESIYHTFARQAGEPDHETWWERHFEHNRSTDSYRLAALEFGRGLRQHEEDTPLRSAETLVREAYMRRRIAETIRKGVAPERIVAIVGAFHAPVMGPDQPPMTDAELADLPRTRSRLTLMPYSYFKLSSQSGYGAGNHAPAYFELMWDAMCADDPEGLPARYLSRVARHLRKSGTIRSAAEVIEGVRLANTLAALKDGTAPALCDLRDAATVLVGHGERSVVAEAMARVEVGTAIGTLPEGVSQTSIQDDFNRELKRLKLERYRTTVKQTLALDLRENRRVKSEEAAFLDLNRSFFLHRLQTLGISFAARQPTRQDAATWAEAWTLQWSPEAEIALVESVLLGETVELATAYAFRQKLGEAGTVDQAAEVIESACACGMFGVMDLARQRLQYLAGEASEFSAVARAAERLRETIRYGDVRRFDPAPLEPLIEQLFLEGALLLPGAANCDNDAARGVLEGMGNLDRISLEYDQLVDEALWHRRLHHLSDADHLNPLLSGFACAILLERGLISNDDLTREVARRLSPGIDADLGAGWFEGLSLRNRYALLARLSLWQGLADYVSSLDDDQFRRALVFLRRAFGSFNASEKRHIAENLGEVWGVGADLASEAIGGALSDDEQQVLDDLGDFDFDDI